MAECTSQNDRRWMALMRIMTKAGKMPQMMASSQTCLISILMRLNPHLPIGWRAGDLLACQADQALGQGQYKGTYRDAIRVGIWVCERGVVDVE